MNEIAVVYKFSALESYSPRQIRRHRELNPELGERMQTAHDDHSRSHEKLRALLTDMGIKADYHERDGLQQSLDGYRFVLSLGGDGTFINASHFAEKTLLLGVNSSPANSVGHYCRFQLKTKKDEAELRRQLEAMLGQKPYPVRERTFQRMQVAVQDRAAPFAVLNDVLFSEENPAATSRYTLRYRSQLHHQKSSGIWVTTPSGSSAAYSSAGGQEFKQRELRFLVRELYSDSPRKKAFPASAKRATPGAPPDTSRFGRKKPLTKGVVKTGEKLHIVCSMMHGALYLDGSHHKIPVALGEHIAISLHPHLLRAIY